MNRLTLALALGLAPGVAGAQQPTAECSDSALVAVRTGAMDGTVSTAPIRRSAGLAIDTTYVLAIDRKRWSERDLSASVAAGLTGTERATWRACFGAWVTMRRAVVEVENARGTVHLRANLAPLRERLRRHSAGRQQEPAGNER